MKRSGNLKEQITSDMNDAQNELETQALQLKNLMKRAWKGMIVTRQSSELERITDQMAEQLQTKAKSIKNRIRKGLLRAHRAGELREIRDELDEISDVVPEPLRPPRVVPGKRWVEYSSESDSSFDPREATRMRASGGGQESPGAARRVPRSRAGSGGSRSVPRNEAPRDAVAWFP